MIAYATLSTKPTNAARIDFLYLKNTATVYNSWAETVSQGTLTPRTVWIIISKSFIKYAFDGGKMGNEIHLLYPLFSFLDSIPKRGNVRQVGGNVSGLSNDGFQSGQQVTGPG